MGFNKLICITRGCYSQIVMGRNLVKCLQSWMHYTGLGTVAKEIQIYVGYNNWLYHYVQGWFNALRNEVYDRNILVTNLCPGPVFSNILKDSFTEQSGKVLDVYNMLYTRVENQHLAQLPQT